jgi:peroxiredoxin
VVLTKSFEKLKKGDKAPDFSLESVDGKTYTLSDFAGKKGMLVVFMCNHCPYVIAKVGAMKGLYEKCGDKIAIVGINSNDPDYPGEGMENMKKFAKENGILFPYLLDKTQEVAKAYGATCTPDPFLFDKDQKLVFHGRINDAMEPEDEVKEHTMDENVQKLVSGEEIGDESKYSIGCSIKWI